MLLSRFYHAERPSKYLLICFCSCFGRAERPSASEHVERLSAAGNVERLSAVGHQHQRVEQFMVGLWRNPRAMMVLLPLKHKYGSRCVSVTSTLACHAGVTGSNPP